MKFVEAQSLIMLDDHSFVAARMATAKVPIASFGLLKFIVNDDIPAQALSSLD